MALQTFVKISNITNLSDARYCAGMGVDQLGFSMDPQSPDYIEPALFADIRGWVAGVAIVGETTSTDPAEIEAMLQTYQPDWLQLGDPALLPYMASFEKPLILRIDTDATPVAQLESVVRDGSATAEYILLESRNGQPVDDAFMAIVDALAGRYPILLGTGISADTIHALLARIPVRGIALRGGTEEQPGNKEFGELMDILEAIEED